MFSPHELGIPWERSKYQPTILPPQHSFNNFNYIKWNYTLFTFNNIKQKDVLPNTCGLLLLLLIQFNSIHSLKENQPKTEEEKTIKSVLNQLKNFLTFVGPLNCSSSVLQLLSCTTINNITAHRNNY